MSEKTITAVVTILLGIIGVAVVATLVSKNSDTPNVIAAFANGFRDALCPALSPLGIKCGRGLVEDVQSTIIFG